MLNRTLGCVRLVWNRILAWRHTRWHSQRLPANVPQANAHLTEMKRDPDLAFLREVSSVPLQQVPRTPQKAFANFFAKRARYPGSRRAPACNRPSTPAPRSAGAAGGCGWPSWTHR